MYQRQHNRSSSQAAKAVSAQGRPTRPAITHKRGTSSSNVHSQAASQSSGWKTCRNPAKRASVEVESDEYRDEGAMASFLQFCITCDKQLVNPCNDGLYCSQACRKRDASHPPSINTAALSSPSISSSASYFDLKPPEIVPQRSPTVLRPASLVFSNLSISDNSSSLEDPVEQSDRRESEAARYLAQFYSPDHMESVVSPRRPRINRISTGESGMPSLTNTPSSSYGTAASISYRSLPARREIPISRNSVTSPRKLLSAGSLTSSADTVTSFEVAEAEDVSYERQRPNSRSQASSGLRQLFRHEAMQAPPRGD